eukprot:1496389-Amphidinium_carterae.1
MAAETLRGFSREMLGRAWNRLALEEHDLFENVVGQAQSWHDRGVLSAEAAPVASRDCQDSQFDDEEMKITMN